MDWFILTANGTVDSYLYVSRIVGSSPTTPFSLGEIMEPYNKKEPFIKMKLNGSLLDRLVEAGIPLTRALQYFRDNPEGPASETAKLVAEETVPFYYNYRNNGDLSDYAKEAALMFAPIKGYKSGKPVRDSRRAVAVDEAGRPNIDDLMEWGKAKHDQYYPLQNTAAKRDKYHKKVEDYDAVINGISETINRKQKQINSYKNIINNSDELPQIKEELARNIPKLEDEIIKDIERRNRIDNDRLKLILDRIDGEPFNYSEAMENLGGPWTELGNPHRANHYLVNKLINEYGEEAARQYYNEMQFRAYRSHGKYPFTESWESLNK